MEPERTPANMPVIFSRVPKFIRSLVTAGPACELNGSGEIEPTLFQRVTPEAFDGSIGTISPRSIDAEDPLFEQDGNGDWMPR